MQYKPISEQMKYWATDDDMQIGETADSVRWNEQNSQRELFFLFFSGNARSLFCAEVISLL